MIEREGEKYIQTDNSDEEESAESYSGAGLPFYKFNLTSREGHTGP